MKTTFLGAGFAVGPKKSVPARRATQKELDASFHGGNLTCPVVPCAARRHGRSIADPFEPFAAFTLGYAASVPPSQSRERPEIVWA
jgi:hypothetical protein